MIKRPRQKQSKVKSFVLPKPKVGDLDKILRGYVTTSESDRINVLATAALWYEDNGKGAIPYVLLNRLYPDTEAKFRKSIDQAAKCRQRAAGTPYMGERDTALRMAVQMYERCCEKLNVPRLATYTDAYDQKKADLEQEEQEAQARYGQSLETIQQALKLPLQIVYCNKCQEYKPVDLVDGCEVTHPDKLEIILATIKKLTLTESASVRSIHLGDGALQYNRQTAQELTKAMKKEGVLPVLLRELPLVVRYSAVEKSANGNWISNRDKHLAFQAQALRGLEGWLKSDQSPDRLVRKGTPTTQFTSTAAAKVPSNRSVNRPTQTGPKKVSLTDPFVAGTKRAALYEAIRDEVWHSFSNLKVAVPGVSIKTELGHIHDRGKRFQKWTVEIQNNQARLVTTQPAVASSTSQTQGGGN